MRSRIKKADIGKSAIRIGIFSIILYGFATYTQLLENVSESLDDVRYLLIVKSTNIKRGDIVSIQGHTPQYVGNHIFTKRVVGLPGDSIIRDKTHLTLKAQNGAFSIILPLLMQSREGQALTPLSLDIVPQGYFFVTGDHLRSFDSRYEEFGLIKKEKIYGKALLKW
ncbi:MAG: signal peptidase I [Caedimonadaceae bacterium]|nr:MAG: signal peptidase I [Caedimonadaceae bacterium]